MCPGNGGISDIAMPSGECLDMEAWWMPQKREDWSGHGGSGRSCRNGERYDRRGNQGFRTDQEAALIESSKVFSKIWWKVWHSRQPNMPFSMTALKRWNACRIVNTLWLWRQMALHWQGLSFVRTNRKHKRLSTISWRHAQFGESGKQVVIEVLNRPGGHHFSFYGRKNHCANGQLTGSQRAYDGDQAWTQGDGHFFSQPGLYWWNCGNLYEKIFIPSINAMNNEGRL